MGKTLKSSGTKDLAPWDVRDTDRFTRSVKSAERTLAVFELFSLYQSPLTIGEIARQLDMPQPSVSMLVKNLVKLGYIEHDRLTRRYVPTIRIMLLGNWIHRRFSREQDMERRLDTLLVETGETVALGIQNGIYSQYVAALLPSDPDRLEVQSGLLRPITCTAVGRALLSLKTAKEITMLVLRCNAEVVDDRLRRDPAAVVALMESIRARGFAETCGDMTPGYSAMAVIIPGPVGSIPMAVVVAAPSERFANKRALILESLRKFKSHFAATRQLG